MIQVQKKLLIFGHNRRCVTPSCQDVAKLGDQLGFSGPKFRLVYLKVWCHLLGCAIETPLAGLYPLDKEWEELHSKPSRLAISVAIGFGTKRSQRFIAQKAKRMVMCTRSSTVSL